MTTHINLLAVALIDDHSEEALQNINVKWFAPARLENHKHDFHLTETSPHSPTESSLKRFKFLDTPTWETPGETFERFGSDPLSILVYSCVGRDDWRRWPGVHSEFDRLQKYVGRGIDIHEAPVSLAGNVRGLNFVLATWCARRSRCMAICQRSEHPKFPGGSYLRVGLTVGAFRMHTPPPALVRNIDECI